VRWQDGIAQGTTRSYQDYCTVEVRVDMIHMRLHFLGGVRHYAEELPATTLLRMVSATYLVYQTYHLVGDAGGLRRDTWDATKPICKRKVGFLSTILHVRGTLGQSKVSS
jgi:hypothetical protein